MLDIFYLSSPLLLCLAVITGLWVLGGIANRLAIKYLTVLDLINTAGKPRKDGKFAGKAVIAGAGIGGLITARILSQHFEEVVMIEPDVVDLSVDPGQSEGSKRPRVMQWRGPHGFLAIIPYICSALFSGFMTEVRKAGMHVGPIDNANYCLYGRSVKGNSDKLPSQISSWRPSLELLIRKSTLSTCPNVKIVRGTVTGYVPSADGRQIAEVAYRPSSVETATSTEAIPSTLFVDCSGISAISTKLLQRANPAWTGAPRRDSYEGRARYLSAYLTIPEDVSPTIDFGTEPWHDMGWVRYIVPDPLYSSKGWAMAKSTSKLLQLTATQWGDSCEPPRTTSGLLAYLEDLERNTKREPAMEQLLTGLRDLLDRLEKAQSPVEWESFAIDQMYFIRYDLASKQALPSNFVVLGDAMMRLNPVFAQGCAKAMVEAVVLDSFLRKSSPKKALPDNFATKFIGQQTLRTSALFDTTRWMDYAFSEVGPMKGETHAVGTLFRRYYRAVIQVAHENRDAADIFLEVIHMVRPATDLFRPVFLLGVPMQWIKYGFNGPKLVRKAA